MSADLVSEACKRDDIDYFLSEALDFEKAEELFNDFYKVYVRRKSNQPRKTLDLPTLFDLVQKDFPPSRWFTVKTDDLLVPTISTCVIGLGAVLSKISNFEKS